MGMGLDATINVAVDADGKMSPQALGSDDPSFSLLSSPVVFRDEGTPYTYSLTQR